MMIYLSPCAILLADIDRPSVPVALIHHHLLCVLVAVGEHALGKVKVKREFFLLWTTNN